MKLHVLAGCPYAVSGLLMVDLEVLDCLQMALGGSQLASRHLG